MNAIKDFQTMHIEGREWWKPAGYHLHSATVYIDGRFVGKWEGQGGQNAYLQTAHQMLQQIGYYAKTGESLKSGASKDYHEFKADMMDYQDKITTSVTTVKRKKDL